MPTSTGDVPAPARGEIWIVDLDKRRPAVVMHRDIAGQLLSAVLVAPVTTSVRDLPTFVRLGPVDGLDRDCAASLDNLTLASRTRFVARVGTVSRARMDELCAALAVAVGCPPPHAGAR